MPLKDAFAEPALENFVGATFAMKNQKGEQVICRVDYAALCDRAQFDHKTDDWVTAWREHHIMIKQLASAIYDSGRPLVEGRVVITTSDLTPAADASHASR